MRRTPAPLLGSARGPSGQQLYGAFTRTWGPRSLRGPGARAGPEPVRRWPRAPGPGGRARPRPTAPAGAGSRSSALPARRVAAGAGAEPRRAGAARGSAVPQRPARGSTAAPSADPGSELPGPERGPRPGDPPRAPRLPRAAGLRAWTAPACPVSAEHPRPPPLCARRAAAAPSSRAPPEPQALSFVEPPPGWCLPPLRPAGRLPGIWAGPKCPSSGTPGAVPPPDLPAPSTAPSSGLCGGAVGGGAVGRAGAGPRRCLICGPGRCGGLALTRPGVLAAEMDGDGGPGALREAGRGAGPTGMEPPAVPRTRAARPGPQRFLRRSVVDSDQEEPPSLEVAEALGAQPPQPLQRRVQLLCKTRRLIAERARSRPAAAPEPAAPPGAPVDLGPEPAGAPEPGPDPAPTPAGGPQEPEAVASRQGDAGAPEARPEPGRARRDEPEEEQDDEDDLKAVATSLDGRFLKFDIELGRGSFKTVYKGLDTETWVEVAWCELQVRACGCGCGGRVRVRPAACPALARGPTWPKGPRAAGCGQCVRRALGAACRTARCAVLTWQSVGPWGLGYCQCSASDSWLRRTDPGCLHVVPLQKQCVQAARRGWGTGSCLQVSTSHVLKGGGALSRVEAKVTSSDPLSSVRGGACWLGPEGLI